MLSNEMGNYFKMISYSGKKYTETLDQFKIIKPVKPKISGSRLRNKEMEPTRAIDIFDPDFSPKMQIKKEINTVKKKMAELHLNYNKVYGSVDKKKKSSESSLSLLLNHKINDPNKQVGPTSVDYERSSKKAYNKKKVERSFSENYYLSHEEDFCKTTRSYIEMSKMKKRGELFNLDKIKMQKNNTDTSFCSKSSKHSSSKFLIMSPSSRPDKQNSIIKNSFSFKKDKRLSFNSLSLLSNKPTTLFKNSKSTPNIMKNFSSIKLLHILDVQRMRVPLDEEKIKKLFTQSKAFVDYKRVPLSSRDEGTIRTLVYNNSSNELPNAYNPYASLNKINNYRKPVSFDITKMVARGKHIDKDAILPFHMKSIYNRMSAESLCAVTLKLNSHSNTKFNIPSGSLIKPTFNCKLKIDNNKKNELADKLKFLENDTKYKDIAMHVKKSLNFYNKNLDYFIEKNRLSKLNVEYNKK